MDEHRQRVELTLSTRIDDTAAVLEWSQRGTSFHEVKLAASRSAAGPGSGLL